MKISLAKSLNSSFAKVLGYRVYGEKKSPFFVRPLHRIFRRINDGVWWFRYRTQSKHAYHIVKTGLEHGYHDIDIRMIHACMNLLVDYVEKERDGENFLEEHIDAMRSDHDPNHPEGVYDDNIKMETEALTIYRWWKNQRQADYDLNDRQLTSLYGRDRSAPHCTEEEFRSVEQEISDRDTEMLVRLMNIRGGLWT